MQEPTRRSFLKAAGATALGGAAPLAHSAAPPRAGAPGHAGSQAGAQAPTQAAAPAEALAGASHDAASTELGWVFFHAEEARAIEALVDRLIPGDELGPGAIDAGVPGFIDRQLAGAWGAGERLYRSGPWPERASESQGYQLPFTPAELFRTALRGIREDLRAHGGVDGFEGLDPIEQDRYLAELERGGKDLAGVPSKNFFKILWDATLEGFFCDPAYGGNRDMVAWRMVGFPGAYANYYELVDRHNQPFDAEPVPLAQHAQAGPGGHGNR